jgi:hypothetical protein
MLSWFSNKRENFIVKYNNKVEPSLVIEVDNNEIDNNEIDNNEIDNNEIDNNLNKEEPKEEPKFYLDIFIKSLSTRTWNSPTFYYTILVDYYIVKIRDVIPYLSTWSFNRQVNENHKDNIKNDLFLQQSPHLMGTIKIARDKKRNCRVIDGQHRLIALREFIDNDIDMKFNFEVLFEVYTLNIEDINNPSNEEFDELENLFCLANKSLNFEAKDNPDKFCRDIVISLSKQYDSIKDNDRVYRPCISQKYLYECLKTYLPKKYYDSKVDEVVNLIKKKNNELSLTNPNNIFRNYENSKKHYEKAKEKGFYLNLADSYYEPEKWISSL